MIYLFSGLGADERVFQYLDISGHEHVFVRWVTPKTDETIAAYAARLREQIEAENPIFIGLSFGGMVAIEVAKQIKTSKLILLSTAKTWHEIPFYFRWIGFLRLHKIVPVSLLKYSNSATNWLFGANTSFSRKLLKQILEDTDPAFLSWAIDRIVAWRNEWLPANSFHIHGTGDRVLPLRFVRCDHIIENGGHLMCLDQAAELNEILRRML
ncbi:MAG: alpha/beta hydrolase [Bacteroidetes bacterium]|nr:alpha/beta hydrolase [Bacteroidota bacterium]